MYWAQCVEVGGVGRARPDLQMSRSWPSPWLAVIISKPSGDGCGPHSNLWDTLERFSLWSSVEPLTVRERERRDRAPDGCAASWQASALGCHKFKVLALFIHIHSAPESPLPPSPVRAELWFPQDRAPAWGRLAHSAHHWGIIAWMSGVALDPEPSGSWL